jgi:hypothetical protein
MSLDKNYYVAYSDEEEEDFDYDDEEYDDEEDE